MSKRIAGLIQMAFVLGLAQAGLAAWDPNTDPSLVAWWAFDDGSGLTAADSSGKGHAGILNGGAAWAPGVKGGALQFDGADDVVVVRDAADLHFAANARYTLAAWVNLTTRPGRWSGIVTKGRDASNWYGIWVNDGNSWVFGHVGNNQVGGGVTAGVWTHVTMTYDNGAKKIYLNGKLDNTLSSSQVGDNTAELWIGGAKGVTEYAPARIDDVRIYSRALSAAEVKSFVPPQLKAVNPTPANGALGVTMTLLQWTPGETAAFVEVYVGTTPQLTAANRVTRQSAMLKAWYQTTPPLESGQTYYWRVDAIDGKSQLIATGDVWSFTMAPVKAFSPVPANGALYQDPNVDLSWAIGQNAESHEVYFSTNRDEVANGAEAGFKGSLFVPTFELPPLPMETTYYWRVDELDSAGVRHIGDVWSFTTTIPGLGAARRELWLNDGGGTAVSDLTGDSRYPGNPTEVNEVSEFASTPDIADNYGGKLSAWLHVPVSGEYTFWLASDDNGQLFLGADPDSARLIASVSDWTGAQEWDKFDEQKSAPITLQAGRYYLMALWKEGTGGDNCAVAWQGPGILTRELIRGSSLMPFEALWAYGPRPRNDANEVTQMPLLKWTAGTKATAHQVYFSGNEQDVIDGTPTAYRGEQAVDVTSYDPGVLEFGGTYYWRVDEVNPAEADSPWKGTVWSFTTADFIVVDDFEDYTDDVVGRIFQTWIDGWGYTEPAPGNPGNGTGSTVGYTTPPFAETNIVHGGRQAMPFDYNNVIQPYYSETDRSWTTGQNWTLNGMNTLSLWFRGYPAKFIDDGATISVSAAGDDIWNTADAFRFAYRRLSGDGSITAKVNSLVNTNAWAKAGVMIRESLAPGSANACTIVSAASGASFQWRVFTDDVSSNASQSGLAAPYWVRLTRTGNTLKGEISADGKAWSVVGDDATLSSHDVTMTGSIYIGLCVTSHNTDDRIVTTAAFSDIKTTGGVSGQWQVADIGMVHPGNDQAQLYVALQDATGKTAVVRHADLSVVQATEWTEWRIPLTQFTGVNTRTIKKMFIGVGDRAAPQAGGSGKLFIDDIRVIKPAQ